MLVRSEILDPSAAKRQTKIVGLGNLAAHGAKVSGEAAAWVLKVGPPILLTLDALLSNWDLPLGRSRVSREVESDTLQSGTVIC